MATKNLETLSGTVEQVNAKQTGIKVNGEWLNVSQYHPVAVMPQPGQLVQVEVERSDRGAWINSLQVLDQGANASPSRERTITRLAVLKAAATFCGGYAQNREEVKSSDVLKIADAWLQWVEQDDEDDR